MKVEPAKSVDGEARVQVGESLANPNCKGAFVELFGQILPPPLAMRRGLAIFFLVNDPSV